MILEDPTSSYKELLSLTSEPRCFFNSCRMRSLALTLWLGFLLLMGCCTFKKACEFSTYEGFSSLVATLSHGCIGIRPELYMMLNTSLLFTVSCEDDCMSLLCFRKF